MMARRLNKAAGQPLGRHSGRQRAGYLEVAAGSMLEQLQHKLVERPPPLRCVAREIDSGLPCPVSGMAVLTLARFLDHAG